MSWPRTSLVCGRQPERVGQRRRLAAVRLEVLRSG